MTERPRLMGPAEIRDLLGVSNQRVWQLVRRPTFPPPVATLGSGRVWLAEAVEAWVAQHGPALDRDG